MNRGRETQMKPRGENMKNQSLKNSALAATLALFAALMMVPPARAQNHGPWSAPVNLNNIVLSDGTTCPAVVNSSSNDNHPTVSKDGLSLIFESNRPGPDQNGQKGLGGPDLWLAKRDSLDDCWQTPVSLGPVVNSAFMDGSPNLTTDGHWLYFLIGGTRATTSAGKIQLTWAARLTLTRLTHRILTRQVPFTSRMKQQVFTISISRKSPSVRLAPFLTST